MGELSQADAVIGPANPCLGIQKDDPDFLSKFGAFLPSSVLEPKWIPTHMYVVGLRVFKASDTNHHLIDAVVARYYRRRVNK